MPMVDPNEGNEFRDVRPGRKLVQGVGLNRWKASTGTPMLTLGFVILRDAAEGGDDTGLIVMARFALTPNALFRLARWAKAQGETAAFDSDDDEAIKRIMARGPVVVTLVPDTYDGKDRVEADKWAPYTGQSDPAWDKALLAGEQEYVAIQQRMAEARAGGSGGGSATATTSGGGHPDDDIPF